MQIYGPYPISWGMGKGQVFLMQRILPESLVFLDTC